MATHPTYNEGVNRTFLEQTPGAFDAGNPLIVELGTISGSTATVIPLSATVANRLGVFVKKLAPTGGGDTNQVSIRLLGGGGTALFKTSGIIAHGAEVSAASGGTVVTGGAARVGRSLSPTCASGDIIEVAIDNDSTT